MSGLRADMRAHMRARGLVVGRGAFRLGPLELDLPPGRRLAVLGPNGAGKSTLLRTLAGLTPALDGTLSAPRPAALLPPPGEVEAAFPVRHMVALGRIGRSPFAPGPSRADLAAAEAALDRLGVADLADRPFDRLSSGQRQLVLIARTAAQGGALVLADEPTATLDPVHAARVAAARDALAGEGALVVIATHDLALAARQDAVLLLTDPPRTGPAGQILTPAALAALYGAPLAVCPGCGRPHG
ncbi:MAG: ATP-binding cassette domain-containing protein [Brevundimonas sp.]